MKKNLNRQEFYSNELTMTRALLHEAVCRLGGTMEVDVKDLHGGAFDVEGDGGSKLRVVIAKGMITA